MLLRLLLVGAVTGLGLDLPSQCDVDRWVSRGHAWWDARMVELADTMPAGEDAFAADGGNAPAVAEAPTPDGARAFAVEVAPAVPVIVAASELADDEFAAVVDAMVASFAPETIAVVSEPVESTPDLYPGLAFALNREAEGLEVVAWVEDAVLVAIEEAEAAKAVAAPETSGAATAPDPRLTTAVELTGQALRAWVALLQTPAVVSAEH